MMCRLTIRAARTETMAIAGARWLTLPLSALAHAVLVTAILVVPALLWRELPPVTKEWLSPPVVLPTGGGQTVAGDNGGQTPIVHEPRQRPRFTVLQKAESTASVSGASAPDPLMDDSPWTTDEGPCWGNCSGKGSGPGSGIEQPKMPEVQQPAEPVRAGPGGVVREPRKLKHVEPTYPALARAARVQGRVALECTLDPTGAVREIAVVEGSVLLAPAAVEAVREWRYLPTLLNGVPVAVRLSVVVVFRLG